MNKRALFVASLLTLYGGLSKSQETIEYGPQVVYTVDHSANGDIYIIPKGLVHFKIGGVTPDDRKAPLPEGTQMLCRAYDYKASNGVFLGLRCGLDTYLVKSVGIRP